MSINMLIILNFIQSIDCSENKTFAVCSTKKLLHLLNLLYISVGNIFKFYCENFVTIRFFLLLRENPQIVEIFLQRFPNNVNSVYKIHNLNTGIIELLIYLQTRFKLHLNSLRDFQFIGVFQPTFEWSILIRCFMSDLIR